MLKDDRSYDTITRHQMWRETGFSSVADLVGAWERGFRERFFTSAWFVDSSDFAVSDMFFREGSSRHEMFVATYLTLDGMTMGAILESLAEVASRQQQSGRSGRSGRGGRSGRSGDDSDGDGGGDAGGGTGHEAGGRPPPELAAAKVVTTRILKGVFKSVCGRSIPIVLVLEDTLVDQLVLSLLAFLDLVQGGADGKKAGGALPGHAGPPREGKV